MRVYFDSSAVVCLYVAEARSAKVLDFAQSLRRPILLNSLQEFEVRNSVRQKVVRGEMEEGMAARCLRAMDDDLIAGRLIRKPVVWDVVFERAEELSRRVSLRRPARAIDLLHVTVAVVSDVRQFATLDDLQAQVAQAAGLEVVELKS